MVSIRSTGDSILPFLFPLCTLTTNLERPKNIENKENTKLRATNRLSQKSGEISICCCFRLSFFILKILLMFNVFLSVYDDDVMVVFFFHVIKTQIPCLLVCCM